MEIEIKSSYYSNSDLTSALPKRVAKTIIEVSNLYDEYKVGVTNFKSDASQFFDGGKRNTDVFLNNISARLNTDLYLQRFKKKSINEGKVEAKNNSRITESISELLDSNLYVEIGELRALEGRRSELDRSVRMLRTDLSYIQQSKSSHEKVISEIHSLETGEKETMQRIKDVKESIEKLFLEYYKKRIRITD